MSEPTELYLPPNLPYPVKIVAHSTQSATEIRRGTRLLSYSFTHTPPNSPPEIRFGTWDSSIEGTVAKWNFKPGETISLRKAKEVPALAVTEPCKHGVQLGGLCCLCGKDMTSFDYTGFSDASRASIQMTHLANGPTVSLEEAQRIERETADHLLKSRKLSLIVDLDQTIVHATVDPTVGEWIAEGEAWESRRAKSAATAVTKSNGEAGSEGTTSDAEDEVNPNWEALKDVKKFKLGPEALGQTDGRGARRKGKDKSVEQDGCMYYIKPRPGWEAFLQTMVATYEMHVYTMGTRAYAEEVCTAIDPENKYFGGRILSRDESGSLTQKSLQRLFPCDQSMVVIIDDRADVWEWSPNLVKVIPYDFFVGIGDINSAFLPKLQPLAPELPPDSLPSIQPPQENTDTSDDTDMPSQLTDTDSLPPSSESSLVIPNAPILDGESSELSQDELLTRNHMALDAQVEERPLAKKQEELQEEESAEESAIPSDEANSAQSTTNGTEIPRPATPTKGHGHRKALLKNDDVELSRVQKLLEEVHKRFYDAYDAREPDSTAQKRKSSKHQEISQVPYDVRMIIPQLRLNTLDGVHILFSSVIPLDTRPESTEIWRTAHAFGAQCYTELNSRITHVVAAKRGTVKVDSARRQGGIKIVWLSWFTDSIALWHRQDETPYLMDPESIVNVGPGSPPSDPHQISSDPEPDADDWDVDRKAVAPPDDKSLALDEVDWDEINNEVEAAMNESDDDDDLRSERSGMRSGNVSEDEWTDESNSIISSVTSTPRKRGKRRRSVTPSDAGTEVLRSPLAKRKRIAAGRSGASRLKQAFSADDLTLLPSDGEKTSKVSTPTSAGNMEDVDEGDEEETGIDEEDDFLARELGEDWG